MSTIELADFTEDNPAEVPLDAAFWRGVATQQARDDAADEAAQKDEAADVQALKNELAVWICKGGFDDQGAVRLLDQAELGRVKWGQVMTLQIRSYQTGRWILFNPHKGSLRSLQGWYSFVRWELNWTGPIRVAVAA